MSTDRWKRIEDLFAQADELPDDERRAFLDAECGGDADLRRELEALFVETDGEVAPFESVVRAAAVSLASGPEASAVGHRIGPYRITSSIGSGGMAEVYKAVRDDEQFEHDVAIKLIRRGLVSNAMLARFRNERQILASLNHPYIARLLDGGTTDDGLPYFVMEYVPGRPITEYCREKKLTLKNRLHLFRSVCSAVQHAHRNLVVHRDLKPSNVLVTDAGDVKLLDFGIAKLLAPSVSPAAVTLAKTMTEVRMMTPQYASPEQVRGEPVTTATDVYALGLILYELLAGECPHHLKDASYAEVERAICIAPVDRPSAAVARNAPSSTRLRRELKGDLDNIVLMALRKEPERRYQSVEQLAEDVRRYLQGRPVTARPDTIGYRANKFVRRHRAMVVSGVAVFLMLATFAVMTGLQAARTARERDRANEVTRFLVGLFEVSSPSQSRGNEVTARELLDEGALKVEREMADQPELQAAMMDTIGSVYRSLGLYDKARPLLERALAQRIALLGPDHPDVGDSLHDLGTLYYFSGDYDLSEQNLRQSLAVRTKAYGEHDARVAEVYSDLGELLRTRSRYDEAEPFLRQALDIRRSVFGNEHEQVAYSLHNLGALLEDKGDIDEAEALYREALAMKRHVLGPDHPSVATTLNNLAGLLSDRGDKVQAEQLYREALALRRRIFGAEHPDLAVSINNLGLILRTNGKYEEAEAMFREALAMKRKMLGPTHSSTAVGMQNLADVLEAQSRFVEAEALYRESLAATLTVFKPDHWRVAAVESALGSCLTKMGKYAEAEKLLVDAHAKLQAALGDDNVRTKDAVDRLARLHEAQARTAGSGRAKSR